MENDVGDQDANDLGLLEHVEVDEKFIQEPAIIKEQENAEEQENFGVQENVKINAQPNLLKSPEKCISFYPMHSAVSQFSTATTELKNSGLEKFEMKSAIAQPNFIEIDLADKKIDVQFTKPIEKLPVMRLKQEAVGNTVTRNTYVENINASFIRELPINQKNILEVDNIAVSNLTHLIRQQVDNVIKSTLATDLVDVVEGEDMRPLKKISVQLFPRSLGVVEVNITNIGGKIKIVIETTSTKAESILRAEMPLIMEKSIASGIAIEDTLVRINQDLERSPTNNDLGNFKQTDINSSSSQENSRNKFLDVGIENEFESSSNELNDDDSPIKTGLYL